MLFCMWCVISQVSEERLFWMRFVMIHNPLLRACREQIGRITFGQTICYVFIAIVHWAISFKWIMEMTINMPGITIEIIESAK